MSRRAELPGSPRPGARGSHAQPGEGVLPSAAERQPTSNLIEAAAAARTRAYAPYSGYAVGAALETASGLVFTGANVENAAYGTSMCAERVALFKAVSEGERALRRLAVVSEGAPPFLCGACRQALAEFAPELEVLMVDSGQVRRRTLADLLPEPFRLGTGRPVARDPGA